MSEPTIGVTIGDPAGIGPEISIKAVLNNEVLDICKSVLIGDLEILEKISRRLRLDVTFRKLDSPRDASGKGGIVEVIDLHNVDVENIKLGVASAMGGKASIEYIKKAVEFALKREIDAIATSPINKEAVHLAGCKHVGHTELLAALVEVETHNELFVTFKYFCSVC